MSTITFKSKTMNRKRKLTLKRKPLKRLLSLQRIITFIYVKLIKLNTLFYILKLNPKEIIFISYLYQ